MALATVEEVRRRGGLNAADDFYLYRVSDEAELDDIVAEDLALAEAYLQDRVASTYYTGSPVGVARYDLIFKRAEILICLAFLTMPLKVRKVEGTHWAVDQEGSDRFAELIDNEYFAQAEILIKPYLDIDTEADVDYGLPVMVVTTPLDRSTIASPECQLQETLDEVNGALGTTL